VRTLKGGAYSDCKLVLTGVAAEQSILTRLYVDALMTARTYRITLPKVLLKKTPGCTLVRKLLQ
jgi:hypothetical protein